MERARATHGEGPEPCWYEIRIGGHLDTRWRSWFDGLALATQSDGTTVLRGPVIDQAALHGVLQKVRNLGLPLLSITPVQADDDHA